MEIEAINDNEIEEDEKIYFVFRNGDCFEDTIALTILDYVQPEFAVPSDTFLCDGESLEVEEIHDTDQLHIFEKSGEFPVGDLERGDCRSSIVVSDLDIELLNERSFYQVCIDHLEHHWLGELEIYLIGPMDQIIELSTNNGEDGDNGNTMDQMINTCFTVDASQLINNGNMDEGEFLSENPTYTGNFVPEESFASFFDVADSPANGRWTLVIRDTEPNFREGMLYQWSLKFSPKYSEQRDYKINGSEVINSPVSITTNSVIEERVSHNYGCLFEKISKIEFTPIPDAPAVICSNPLRNQVFLEWSSDVADEYELKFGGADWMVIEDAESYLFDNLGLGSSYQFQIRSVTRGCLGPSETFFCETPECGVTEIVIDEIIPSSSGCQDDGVAMLFANGSDGPYTFRINERTNATGVFQDLATNAYRVYLEDRYGCTFTKTFEVGGVAPFEMEIQHRKVSCDDNVKGSAWVEVSGGQPPYIYRWSNGERTDKIEKLRSGIYSVTVGDINGCIQSLDVTIVNSAPPTLAYESEDVLCYTSATGAIELSASGGEGPYTFRWDDGYASVLTRRENLAAGTYQITVIDYNLCEGVATVDVDEPEEFSATVDLEHNQCPDAGDGIAVLNITGGVQPYDVFWSTGNREKVLRNLQGGNYSVTITDAKGCEIRENIEITAPEKMNLIFDHGPITCNNGEDGSISVAVVGGSGNYAFAWDNGKSKNVINNLSAGQYCVSVTDGLGCIGNGCFTLDEPESMTITIEITNVTCYQGKDGTLNVNIEGGITPFLLEINGDQVQPDASGLITGLRAGQYFIKTTDGNGCRATKVIEIFDAPEPQIIPEVENVLCFGDNSGSVFLKYLNEPNAPVQWTDAKGNNYSGRYLSSMYSGEYHYEITTSSGCMLSGSVSIEEPADPLHLEVDYHDITCYGDRNGEITMTAQGGGGSYFYSMDGVGYQRSGFYSGLQEGTYHTFAQDINGCITRGDSITISDPPAIIARISSDTIVESGTDVGCIPFFRLSSFFPKELRESVPLIVHSQISETDYVCNSFWSPSLS